MKDERRTDPARTDEEVRAIRAEYAVEEASAATAEIAELEAAQNARRPASGGGELS